ncbi:XK-related protein 8-like [Megalops cyprinoides]|uniref:XK-related protein 8-like n=1 Tax=Megalops cyprinoides TaxID=118141 RepID=UPI0018641300|nr:XK-related protein 8-like [Megalops cyprinoides]
MECSTFSTYSWLDFAFAVIGVCTFLFDVGSDLWVAKEFYVEGDFFWFGVLVSFMVLSSVVVQMFSWFWYKYDRELQGFQTAGENVLLCSDGRCKLYCWLHVLQLGFFFRHISAIKEGFQVWWQRKRGSEYAVYMTHDLSMLRLIETFCESAPQLTLMLYIMLRTNRARTMQYVSVAASTSSVAWMVVDYHRSLRSFLPDKAQQGWGSSVLYFLWNLLLIAPRVGAVALFASVLPAYIAVHFLSLWPALVLWAWRQETDFMDSAGGEWLYRATVGLIWYFSWFNVTEGRTRGRSTIYHSLMVADGAILLLTWWWYRDPDLTQSYAGGLLLALPLAYLVGLLLKGLYYTCSHPKLYSQSGQAGEDVPDAQEPRQFHSLQTAVSSPLWNKRMAGHAQYFYSTGSPQPLVSRNRNKSTSAISEREQTYL